MSTPSASAETPLTEVDRELMWEARQGNEAAVARCLGEGANPTAFDRRGHNALMLCCERPPARQRMGIIESLLAAGTDPNATRDDTGKTALRLLCEQVRERNEGGDVGRWRAGAVATLADTDGMTPLHAAAARGHLPVVQALLASGASVDFRMRNGTTALMLAAAARQAAVVRVLLDAGANPNAVQQGSGWTAYLFAAGHDDIASLRRLHQRGGDVTRRTGTGQDALWLTKSVECVRFLYGQGLRAPRGGAGDTFKRWHLDRHGAEGAACVALCATLDGLIEHHAAVDSGLCATRAGTRRRA